MYGSATYLISSGYGRKMSRAVLAEFICTFAIHLLSAFTRCTICTDVKLMYVAVALALLCLLFRRWIVPRKQDIFYSAT
jgi:hypothetical protein